MGKTGKTFGYLRVSTKEQNSDRQIDIMEDLGIDERDIFVDKYTGSNFERDKYQLLKMVVREGDTVYIKELDRLGRNKQEILEELKWFKDNKIRTKILDVPTTLIDFKEGQEWLLEMVNNLMIEVLATMAEQELVKNKQRQSEGIASAKKRGKHLGRPKKDLDPDKLRSVLDRWAEGELIVKQACLQLGISHTHFYKIVKDRKIVKKENV